MIVIGPRNDQKSLTCHSVADGTRAATGPACAIDSGGALVNAGDESVLVLQVFAAQRNLVAVVEVIWPGFVCRCWIGHGAVDAVVGAARTPKLRVNGRPPRNCSE